MYHALELAKDKCECVAEPLASACGLRMGAVARVGLRWGAGRTNGWKASPIPGE